MAREFLLNSEGRIQDNYFRFDAGIAQNERTEIILDDDLYISQIVIRCYQNSQVKLSIRLPSGTEYDVKSFTSSATDFYFNDGNDFIFWNQLPKGSRLLITKIDASSTGIIEAAITSRPPFQKPSEII